MKRNIAIISVLVVLSVLLISGCTTTSNNEETETQNLASTEYKVVTRLEEGPDPTGFQPTKAEAAEGSLNENVVVVTERVLNNDANALKKGTVQPVGEEGLSSWQLLSDEGQATHEQFAPNPLNYMVTGIASDLQTQVERGIEIMELDVEDVKVEAKVFYRYEDFMTGQWSGYTDKAIVNILIESDESPEKIAELKELALSSWTAGEGLANKTEVLPELLINGQHWDTHYATNGSVPDPDSVSVDNGQTLSSKSVLPEIETFDPGEDLDMSGVASGQIDNFEFVVVAVSESANDPERPYLHKVTARSLNDNYFAFDLYVDDSYGYEGPDKAPASLDYLTAGTAFCLMSQLTVNDMFFRDVVIDDYRVEQQIDYRQEDYMTTDMAGYADTVISKVIVNSQADEEALNQYFVQSVRCCFAGEAFLNETEVESNIYLNGNIVE